MTMEITDAQRKRLLHAYETFGFAMHQCLPTWTKEQIALWNAAKKDIFTILDVQHLATDLHTGGEWADNGAYDSLWEHLT